MSIIPDKLFIKVQQDFKALDKDGNNVLNAKKDNISIDNGAKFFIDLNQDVDIETFYQYNADKYGEDITDAFEAKREEVSKSYANLKNKEKPSIELMNNSEYLVDPTNKEMVEKFYRQPEEGMVYNFKGVDIKYQNGKYFCPGRDYEPCKIIQGIIFYLKKDLSDNLLEESNTDFDNAKSQEEKDAAVKNYINGLFKIDGKFDYDFLIANNYPGTKFSRSVIIGTESNRNIVRINYTLGEKEVILNDYKFYPEN